MPADNQEPHEEPQEEPQAEDGEPMLDPEFVAVLEKLWVASETSPDRPWSLAKLCKQSGLAMSTLRRHLVVLEDAGIAQADVLEDGTGKAWLTPAGIDLCKTLLAE